MAQHEPHRDEDFVAVPPATQGPTPAAPVADPRRTRWTSLARRPAALVTVGVLAGGAVVGVAGHQLSQPASATTVAAGAAGTLSADDGSDITVTTAAGEQTFTVDDATRVVQDGQEVALSDLTTGEDVVLHVYPSGNGWALERVMAGTAAQGGPGGLGTAPPGPADDQGADDPSTSATT